MTTQWYYAHDENKLGPFSQLQLKELAAAGTLLPIDTVWQHGIEHGVQASRIKNLFLHPAPGATQQIDDALAAEAAKPAADSTSDTKLAPLEKPEASKVQPKAPPKRGRATALKGADIVGQDGTHARYRKKCLTCGQKDSACHTVLITNKLIKANYFCPKCRKRREVAIQCQL